MRIPRYITSPGYLTPPMLRFKEDCLGAVYWVSKYASAAVKRGDPNCPWGEEAISARVGGNSPPLLESGYSQSAIFSGPKDLLAIICTTPRHALVHETFSVATAGGPSSLAEEGSAANTPGGTTAKPAAGRRRERPGHILLL